MRAALPGRPDIDVDRTTILENETALRSSQESVSKTTGVIAFFGLSLFVGLSVPLMMLADNLSSGPGRFLIFAGLLTAALCPLLVAFLGLNRRRQTTLMETMNRFEVELTSALERAEAEAEIRETQGRRQDFETRLSNALEMADGEGEVLDVVERAFQATVPDSPAELLLADNSHAHLARMATHAPSGAVPMCSVDSPDHCPAARRAQLQRFNDSAAIDACPKLRDRGEQGCSALCVPVSVMGRTVGVIHTVAEVGSTPSDAMIQDLGTLAKLAGARIGVLRMMAETQIQASTDSLTGLLNRRAMENSVRGLGDQPGWSTVVMADLDHFKTLNDTYGHETGDRALRTFAQILRDSVRHDDLVARYGGEEFAMVLPNCPLPQAAQMLNRVRANYITALQAAGLPLVTASFGVVSRHPDEDLATSLGRADVAMFRAKQEGRDRIVVDDDDVSASDEELARLATPILDVVDLPGIS